MNEISTTDLQQSLVQSFELSPASTDPARARAMESFKKAGLPGRRTEEYRFTPITRALEKHFKSDELIRTTSGNVSAADIDHLLIPGYDADLIVFVNGRYNGSLSRITNATKEVTVSDLSIETSAARAFLHQLAVPSEDPFTALNGALWQGGISIEVPENTVVKRPFQILHISDSREQNVSSHTRLLVIVGKGSEVTITEKHHSIGNNAIFYTTVEEVEVGANATLNYHRIQNDSGKIIQAGATRIHQNNGSRVNTFTLTLDGELIRNNLGIQVDGEGCESHFNGLYLLNDTTLADNHTVVDHLKPNSFSNELYKGIMDGSSKGVFNGKIYVRPHAQKTNAFQSNRNILLSDTATVNTKPQLEIWADDVKCSHGCTSGQLDEEAIFYLQSRGIAKHTARAMVLYAFAGEVLATVKDPILKSYLDTLVSGRLLKDL